MKEKRTIKKPVKAADSAHPTCMKYDEQLAKRALNSPWQCNDCKTCYICEDAGDPDAMLFCDACDKGYHMDCHNPPVEEKPTGSWVCSKCLLEQNEQPMELELEREVSRDSISTSTEGPSSLPTPGCSPVPLQEGAPDQNANTVKHKRRAQSPEPMMNGHVNVPLPRLSETLPLRVPDAAGWTIDDVASYFRGVGFPDQAEIFRDQEIDGKSLLLMKRSDVLTGLSIKLGPAVKIYAHIQRLQTMGHGGF